MAKTESLGHHVGSGWARLSLFLDEGEQLLEFGLWHVAPRRASVARHRATGHERMQPDKVRIHRTR
jgi:hypothetical protein